MKISKLVKTAGGFVINEYATPENIEKATKFTTKQLHKGVLKLQEKSPQIKESLKTAKDKGKTIQEKSKKSLRRIRSKSRENAHRRKELKNPVQMQRLTTRLIDKALDSQVVQSKRETFLREHFKEGEYLELALKEGPQKVYTLKTIKEKAEGVIKEETNKESVFIFAQELLQDEKEDNLSGFYQRVSFLLHVGQKIGYLFGEEELDTFGEGDFSHYIALSYLAVMTGIKGAKPFFYALRHHPELVTTTEAKRMAALVGQKLSKNKVTKSAEEKLKKVSGEDYHELQFFDVKPKLKRLLQTFLQEEKGTLKDTHREEVHHELQQTYD